MLNQKIPATVVTGFLGAGKTTMIRHMLANAGGRRIALIINEFGDLGVDGDVLKGCGEETCTEDDIVELTNGCICCTVADDFIPAMETLLERENRPDHIVIETSGLALPQPLVAAFNWPAIKTQVTVDGVVTVVDSAAVAAGRFADDPAKVDAQRMRRSLARPRKPAGGALRGPADGGRPRRPQQDGPDRRGRARRRQGRDRRAQPPHAGDDRGERRAGSRRRAARARRRHGGGHRQPQVASRTRARGRRAARP